MSEKGTFFVDIIYLVRTKIWKAKLIGGLLNEG